MAIFYLVIAIVWVVIALLWGFSFKMRYDDGDGSWILSLYIVMVVLSTIVAAINFVTAGIYFAN